MGPSGYIVPPSKFGPEDEMNLRLISTEAHLFDFQTSKEGEIEISREAVHIATFELTQGGDWAQ